MNNTVLIIDDDTTVIEMIQVLLTQQGYQVLTALDGQDGYWIARTKVPGLIICDLLLPRGHGFDLIQKIKGKKSLQAIPVILITAVYKGHHYKVKGKNYGAAAFIEKPLDPDVLVDTVRRLLPLPGDAPRSSDEQLDKQLARLRAEYISKLPAVIDWITNHCDMLLNGDWDVGAARMLHQASHRLIGSCKNLKLGSLGEAAHRMESLLDALLERGTAPTIAERGQLENLLTDLGAAVNDQTGASSSSV